ncbi:hypothetical protein BDP27DRAFT_452560 [Rhodocollybia butyracea]|uniref:Uncharacterized protein n=1 Tax=Rhodocollybia butyracea TaxID=206335 RepID=A0A9P5PBG9_9AGAR|nr:hypothetical protein BDP27DRAFT_452560 [Rhodocollybia butyracea]
MFLRSGIEIYYVAASWPYDVGSSISLDGDTATYVDLRDWTSTETSGGSASEHATVHWYRTGLENTSHTIVISLPANDSDTNDSDTYAVVDAFM